MLFFWAVWLCNLGFVEADKRERGGSINFALSIPLHSLHASTNRELLTLL